MGSLRVPDWIIPKGMVTYLVSTPPGGAVARAPLLPVFLHITLHRKWFVVSNGIAY